MVEISIVIASLRRGGSLQRTMASCLAQRGIDPTNLEIIVCDLSSHISGGAVARNLAEEAARAGISFRYLRDPQGSPARNSGIDEAAGELVALIEDGAEADPYWLYRLRDCQECYDAQIVVGPVFPRFDDHTRPDDVVRRRSFAYDQRLPTGKPLQRDGGYGNCLIAKPLCRRHGAEIRPLPRGEFGNASFLRDLARTGVRAVWCADALVYRPTQIVSSDIRNDRHDDAGQVMAHIGSGSDSDHLAVSEPRSGIVRSLGGSAADLFHHFSRR